MEHPFEHLTDAQIEHYGDRTSGEGPNQSSLERDQAIETHLADCAGCRTRVLDFHRARLGLMSNPVPSAANLSDPDNPSYQNRGYKNQSSGRSNAANAPLAEIIGRDERRPTPDCPTEDTLHDLAAGLSTPSDAARLTQHAAQCPHCGPILRTYSEDFSDELSPQDAALLQQLNSSSPAWQRHLAQQLAEAVSPVASSAQAPAASSSTSAAPEHAASGKAGVAQPGSPVSPALAGRGEQPPSAVDHATPETNRVAQAPSPVLGSTRTISPKSAFRLPSLKWILAPTALAATAVVAFFIWNAQRETPEKVEKLLAQAYTEQRTMEMRWPGAGFAAIHVTRGSDQLGTSQPVSLLRAAARAREEATKNPNDADWLRIQGEVELLDWRLYDALRHFEAGLQRQPSSFQLLQNIGITHYQIAQTSDRDLNCALAVEYLSRALAILPKDPTAMYNRAIANECIQAYQSALEDWDKYLQLDNTSEWSREAQKRRDAIKALLKRHDTARNFPFIQSPAVLPQKLAQPSMNDDSDQVREFITLWEQSQRNAATKGHLTLLSSQVLREHNDSWLTDAALEAQSSTARNALFELRDAAADNAAGSPSDAAAHAAKAEKLVTARQKALGLGASFEQVYALRREVKPCAKAASSLFEQLQHTTYHWLKIQALLEFSSCHLIEERLDDAQSEIDKALLLASDAHYSSLHVRALGFLAAIERRKGEFRNSWEVSMAGIREFWSNPTQPIRAYSLYADLSFLMEDLQLTNVAQTCEFEAVAQIASVGNKSVEAMARNRLANLAIVNSDLTRAENEYRISEHLFKALPDTPVTRTYKIDSKLGLARLTMDNHPASNLEKELLAMHQDIDGLHSFVVIARFYATLGRLQYRLGQLIQAEDSLASAVLWAERELASLKNPWDRALWERQNGSIYRMLVQTELDLRKEKSAYAVWRWYLTAPATNVPPELYAETGRKQITLDELIKDRVLRISARKQATPRGKIVIYYAVLQKGIAVWVSTAEGARLVSVLHSVEYLKSASAQLIDECSDPNSKTDDFEKLSSELYHALLRPALSEANTVTNLTIVPDGFLALLPFNALLGPDGQYAGAEFPIIIATQPKIPVSTQYAQHELLSDLIVESTATTPAAPIPVPGVSREGAEVAAQLRKPRILSGSAVSAEKLAQALETASVFHFIGHSISSPNDLSLVLPAQQGDDSQSYTLFSTSQLRAGYLSHCRLVVLSACSTFGHKASPYDEASTGVRFFLKSGAHFVIASRWNIDSGETVPFMAEFYRRFRKVDDPAIALRDTQQYQLSKIRHPYYWAAFTVFGTIN